MQYIPTLTAAGHDIEVLPFFDDKYLQQLYSGRADRLATPIYFLNRIKEVLKCKNLDLIWIEKEAYPWLPWLVERLLLPRNVQIVSDYDDAVFHRYDQNKRQLVRKLLGQKIDNVMKSSVLVTAGNQYLAERAKAAGAGWVEVVPTVVDTTVYSTESHLQPDEIPRIGWIGTPGTWRDYGDPLLPVLSEVCRMNGARVRAIGTAATPTSELEVLPWFEDQEVSLIQSMTIGIMPLDDSSWSQGKCGYKLIQYMACGIPVVASPVGVNPTIVKHGVNGFLASTDAEWREALVTLLRDPGLRRRMGAAGRRKVEEHFSLQVWGPRVAGMLTNAARGNRA